MTEQDVFERRLRTALLRRVADGPTGFDALGFARAVAAKEPRRHGFAATLGWRRVAIPRGTWVLLLAAVLTALVAGILVVGSQPVRKLPAVVLPVGPEFACPPGSTPNTPGPVDQARPPISFVAPMAFDRQAGRIVLLAEGYAAPGPETWTFDVCTNTWMRMYPAREPTGGGHLVYDVDADLTIAIDVSGGGAVWAYDLEANTWTAKRAVPVSLSRQPGVAYDPASSLILVLASTTGVESEPSELWAYDVETDTWSLIPQANAPDVERAHQGVLAYDPSVDRLISYLPSEDPTDRTRLFDFRTGTWSTPGAAAPHVMFGWGPSGGEIAYDESVQQTVIFSYGRVVAYDAAADRWEILVAGFDPGETMDGLNGPTVRWMPSMVYDPVNHRFVVYGGQYPIDGQETVSWVQADDVLAFDPVTRGWRVLLDARTVSASPS